MASKPLTIFFHAADGTGHLNASVGLAQTLKSRNHNVFFLLNSAFEGQFSSFGFNEILLEKPKLQDAEKLQNVSKAESNLVKESAESLLKSGFIGPLSPLEKMKDCIKKGKSNLDFIDTFYQTMEDFHPQIEAAILKEKPDVFVLDHQFVPSCVIKEKIPWVLLFSMNPLSLFNSEKLPPFGSGYSVYSDPVLWTEFRDFFKQQLALSKILPPAYQVKLCTKFNFDLLEEDNPFTASDQLFLRSKFLNVYGFPEELDYTDVVPIGESCVRVDSFCRFVAEPFTLPDGFKNAEKVIYFSLGTLGSIDVDLVKKVLAVLEKTPYKCIVSKGQRADEFDLPTNCWGEKYLPQTNILPLVDLVITHGGNNTVTETLVFGKPMIVMPLFGDQYDNAQRVQDKGFGIRVEPYSFTEKELLGAIEKLLYDEKLKIKLQITPTCFAKNPMSQGPDNDILKGLGMRKMIAYSVFPHQIWFFRYLHFNLIRFGFTQKLITLQPVARFT